MSRKPVPHSRPAAPPLPFCGRRLWGCIIARPPKDGPEVIQQIVNLMDADRSLKPGQAIERIAKKIGGREWKRYWERLRKRWPDLEQNGLLPKPQTEDVLQEQIAAGIREGYGRREAARETAAQELASKEEEAESSFGLQVKGHNATDLIRSLEQTKERLDGIINQPLDEVVSYYQREGIEREDAVARHLKYRKEYHQLDKQIAILREIRDLRRKAGVGG